MKRTKRTICIILMLAISLSCFACAKPATPVVSADKTSVHSQKMTPEPTQEPTAELTAEPTAEPTDEPIPEPTAEWEWLPNVEPEPIPLPELDFVISESVKYTMPWEKSPKKYSKAAVKLPCNFEERAEYNEHIFSIDPFEISFALPAGWSIKDEPDENGQMFGFAGFMSLFSKQYLFDETGRCIGAFGYNLRDEMNPSSMGAMYPGIGLANHYRFDFSGYNGGYATVTELKNTVTEITNVYYDSGFMQPFPYTTMYNKQGRLNYGILSHDPNELYFVAFELCRDYVTEEQYVDIAQSLRFE